MPSNRGSSLIEGASTPILSSPTTKRRPRAWSAPGLKNSGYRSDRASPKPASLPRSRASWWDGPCGSRLSSHGRSEDHASPVRRPPGKARAASAVFVVGELLESAAVCLDRVDLPDPAGIGLERQRATVRIPRQQLVADLDGVAGTCSDWGCGYVVVPALPKEYRSREGYLRFAAEAKAIVERLRPFGLQLAYHNHSHELERFGPHTGLEILFAETTPDILSAELDTYWIQYAGASPAAWIRRLRGRVPLVHLKDMVVSDGHPVQAEVGEGNLDWVEILSACRDAGTQWLVVEQDESRDAMESAAISYANLARLALELRLEC